MAFLKRFLYFAYYLRQTDKATLRKFLDYAANSTERSRQAIFLDAVSSTFKYNISLLDYFYFRFFELNHSERQKWAGTGFLYEYQLQMNPKGKREVLEDKIRFLSHFKPFVRRSFVRLDDLQNHPDLALSLLENASERVVLKGSRGQVGREVEVVKAADFTPESLVRRMQAKDYDLAEEYVVQHPALMALSPSGLNTLRIFTQLYQGEVELLGARLRVSVNSAVDNLGAGNLAAPIDPDTGRVNGPGVYSDITKSDEAVHPITGIPFEGFQLPFWTEALQMAKDAALFNTDNRSIGWDIAITPNGPELIEGNHNWCKLLWQLPVKQGLKEMLLKYSKK